MSAPGPPTEHVRSLIAGRIARVFAHFFDTHFLAEKGVHRFRAHALNEMRLAIRFAALLADEIHIPAAFFFESELCREVLSEYDPQLFAGQIFLVATGANVDEFVEKKLSQYSADNPFGALYRKTDRNLSFPWRTRFKSATKDITADWLRLVDQDGFEAFKKSIYEDQPPDFDRRLVELPERLGDAAFIVRHIVPILFEHQNISLATQNKLHSIINSAYFRSYAIELRAAVIQNMNYLASSVPVPSGDAANDIDFRALQRACRDQRVLRDIMRAQGAGLLAMRSDERFIAAQIAAAGDPEMRSRLEFYRTEGRHLVPAGATTGPQTSDHVTAKVLVVTARPEEAAAMLAIFDEFRTIGVKGDGNIYQLGVLSRRDAGLREVLLVTASDMGKAVASALTTNALRSFPSIEHIVMVGIAGGAPNPEVPDEHVRLGDIVVSDERGIFEYDDIKLSAKGSAERRGVRERPSHAMIQAFNTLRSKADLGQRPWESHIEEGLSRLCESYKDYSRPDASTDVLHVGDVVVEHPPRKRPDHPHVHSGGIGSADILLKDPALRDELRDSHGIRAFEMEASGVQGAGWAQDRDVMVVRGISDYCDAHKADRWRYAAALAAAAFARSMIEILPEEWFS
jgi:nucleoside phosphorylase